MLIALPAALLAGCLPPLAPPPHGKPEIRPERSRLEKPYSPVPEGYRPPDFPWEGYERKAGRKEPAPDPSKLGFSQYSYRVYGIGGWTYVYPPLGYGWPHWTGYGVHEHHDHETGKSTYEFTPNFSGPWWWPYPHGKYEHHHHNE